MMDSRLDPVDLKHCMRYYKWLNINKLPIPKNRIQFHKGQSLPEFLESYGTDPQGEDALFQALWPEGFQCPECGYEKSCRLRTRNVWQCIRCKHQASLTAGALFDNTKLPLRTWRLAMYLLTQSKNGISAMDLKRQLGVSYNTAWRVKQKLMQAMRERDDRQPLQGTVERDDAYLGGEASGGKRGRGAAGKTPFVAAAQVSGEGRPQRLRLSPLRGLRLQELEARARRRRQPGTVVRSDGLSCFRGGGGRWLRTRAERHRRRQGQLRNARANLGEHAAGQRQAGDRRNLSRLRSAIRGALPCRVRLPLQPALPAGRSRPPARLCRGAYPSAASPPLNVGWYCWVIGKRIRVHFRRENRWSGRQESRTARHGVPTKRNRWESGS